MIVVGIDPDSTKHGFAEYWDGELVNMMSMSLMDILDWLEDTKGEERIFSIEDVMANNFIYARNQASKKVQSDIARKVGRCQQAQYELMQLLDKLEIPYKLHKPTRRNWAKDKARFEAMTGWKGRSNEDNRSAAYFGFLEALP